MAKFFYLVLLSLPLGAGVVVTTTTSAQAMFSDGSSYQKNCQTQAIGFSCAINDVINDVAFVAQTFTGSSSNGAGAHMQPRFFIQFPQHPNTPSLVRGYVSATADAVYSDLVLVTGVAAGTFTINLTGSAGTDTGIGGGASVQIPGSSCLPFQQCQSLSGSISFPFQGDVVFPVQFSMLRVSADDSVLFGYGDAGGTAQITGFTVTGGTVFSQSGTFGTQADLPEPATWVLTGLALCGLALLTKEKTWKNTYTH